ncbi:MAG: hypothetical protein K8I82_03350 [Anaerolineae bacterium]|nr:hypothetical protein [Anaerolineae bacterium]
MRRVMILVAVLLVSALTPATAQETTPPDYLRFCDASDTQELISTFNQISPQLDQLEQALVPFESGNLTYIEGVAMAEGFVASWEQMPLPDCLLPVKKDVDDVLNDLLLAMMYGQLENQAKSDEHMQLSVALREQVRVNVQAALEFLNLAPVAPEETPESSTDPNALRTGEELNPQIQSHLMENGVTVLDNAGIQVFPGNTLVLIQLNRFSAEYDYANVLFTLDQLADLIRDWPETQEISSIVVETYEGTERVLLVTVPGEVFREYYYNGALTKEEFEAQLVQQ